MKLGFLIACLPDIALADLLQWAQENQFQALELAAWPVASDRDYQARQIDAARMTPAEAGRVTELFREHDLEISALAYYDNNLHPDLAQREGYHDHLRRVIDTAALLQVGLVGTFVGARPDLSPAENIREIGGVFRGLTAYAADKGVRIMIENCPMENWVRFGFPGNYAFSPELWSALFNEVPSDNFGLNLDPSHLHWLGIDYLRAVREFAPKIFHAHAKDTEILPEGRHHHSIFGTQIDPAPWKSGWWRYRLPGLGEIDWRAFISALQENGYDYVLSIEHEDPVWEGSEEKIKRGLVLGRKHLSPFII
ncbi:MAG TPA: sugar phosphate isomerase/epimerase [bacterium]|nr:sugar phosphate isomerase/epimerase [bacterium]HPG83429.1 sugar phosphate isomerase/epimerase [bacterium]